MTLEKYQKKRKFDKTSEPKGKTGSSKSNIFVVQKHRATNLHYDLRIAYQGVLKSWAVPKKPLLQAGKKRLAIQTEDHPLEYAKFEGKIPEGEYGAGTVKIWDKGKCELIKKDFKNGHLQIYFKGDKLKGIYNLIKTNQKKGKNWWILFKSKQ